MASTSAKPLQNIYYERKVATEKPCYICKRPTVVVLATIDTKDFLYTCDSHLTDSGFATLLSPPPAPVPSGPSQEEIKKVIADYKAREEKKGAKLDNKDKDKKDDKDKKEDIPKPASPIPSSPAPTPAASHRKFALHRQIFEMRRDDIKRKEQGVKAREVGKGLPQVPRGMF